MFRSRFFWRLYSGYIVVVAVFAILVGVAVTDWSGEGLSKGFETTRHPRTVIARDRAGVLWLITIDGRQPGRASGMTFAEMQAWLQDWYGVSYEPVMKPGDEKMMERLVALSGAEFEIAFMEMMIKHHEKAIREGRHCLDKAYHAELRELCENIIATQSAEIAQMETWLCQWYGECN